MIERIRKHRDFIQNITIAVLCVSAVLLFAQTQIYNLGIQTDLASFLAESELPVNPAAPNQGKAALTAPVRVAATSAFGRYGSITLTTDDEAFEPLRGLLEQALTAARDFVPSTPQMFFSAVDSTSVYYDFYSPLPLSILAELVQSTGDEDLSARYLVVSKSEHAVVLHLWDGDSGYFRCTTALPLDTLEQTISQYELGNAYFAFESSDPNAWAAAPYSLFLETEPSLPQLSISIPLSDTDHLLTALDFNPNTQYRYMDASGAEVVRESDRTLRIHTDGTITYSGGNNVVLPITPGGETPSLLEAVEAVNSVLHSLVSSESDGSLYLESVSRSGDNTVLRFGYQAGGIPIRFTDGQSAAEVTLSGDAISALTFRLRQYTLTGTESLVLPLRQALAIHASSCEGAELSIGYADRGAGTVSAGWIAD